MKAVIVAALYKFVALDDCERLRGPLLDACLEAGVQGTLLLAPEGVNGTVAGSRAGVDAVLRHLRGDPRLADLQHKESRGEAPPFHRMKVKLKREIVTLGVPGANPGQRVGAYVEPRDWNALLADPELLLIDTRNHYEVAIGTFENALDPQTSSFREFPAFARRRCDPARHKKVAMFCTGGIRCEKASAFMLNEGFEQVFHLRGGILNYLAQVPPTRSKWQGECFVFDGRVSVDHALRPGRYDQCHGCRHPVAEADKRSPFYRAGVCCPRCHDKLGAARKAGFAERHRQVALAAARNQRHIGAPVPAPARRRGVVR